jgi:hypothetical protein
MGYGNEARVGYVSCPSSENVTVKTLNDTGIITVTAILSCYIIS